MGVTVRQKVKGRGNPWWVFIAHNGKQKSIKLGSKDAANDLRKQMETDLARGKLNLETEEQKEILTFGEYSKEWLKEYVSTLRYSTYEKYEGLLRLHVVPVLGEIRLDQTSKGTVKSLLLAKKKEEYSRQTLADILSIINNVFEYANDRDGFELDAPTKGLLKKVKAGKKRRELDPSEVYTEEESNLFLDTCQAHFPEWYPFYLMALRTGLGLGELIALRWEDVSFATKSLWTRQSYRRKEIYSPKDEDTRQVDMSDQLIEGLKEWKHKQKKLGMRMGLGQEPELVFHDNGRHYEQNFVRKIFNQIQRKAELRRIKVHGLRHTFATQLLEKGVSISYISKQLGHSDIETTFRHYIHWVENQKEKAEVNVLDAPNCTLYAPSAQKGGLSC